MWGLKMKVSVIIPVYNASKSIKQCLESIYNTKYKDFEVLVVDDNSTDNSVEIIKNFPCKLIKFNKNKGPAVARNTGAREANGNILMFIDSDAIQQEDNINKIVDDFKKYPDIASVSGMFSKESISKGWFAKYRDLQIHYWHKSTSRTSTIFMVTTGAIKKDIFFEVGCFNENYNAADVEDYEIGHRIAKKYKMLVDDDIVFKHYEYASSFIKLTKKLFKRTMLWTPLFLKRKRFENNYATANRGLGVLFASLSLISLILITINLNFLIVFFALFILFLLTDIRFYPFLLKEGGFFFLTYSIFLYYYFNIIISLGGIFGLLKNIIKND